MGSSASLRQYLQRHRVLTAAMMEVSPAELPESLVRLGVSPDQVAVPVLLQSERNALLMAVVPLSRRLDIERINALLRRQFREVDSVTASRIFNDAEPGAAPPFGDIYRIPCMVDRSLMGQPMVYFRAGSQSELVAVRGEDFRFLMSSAPKAVICGDNALPSVTLPPMTEEERRTPEGIRQTLEKIHRLPPMPPMAMKIIQTVNDPDSTVDDLAQWIELDPSLAAQIIRYASSPFYGYRGKITSVREAINRVLGFELVGHIALGIATTKAFTVMRDGPLGLKAFWQHSLSCAVLAQALARRINRPDLLDPSLAYLCGLLHNIGLLLIGHLFQPEFGMLNRLVRSHPAEPLYKIEQRVIGLGQAQQVISLGHAEIGATLLTHWNLPEEVVAVCRYHHDDACDSPHEAYVRLIQVANVLLAGQGIGDLGIGAENTLLPDHQLPLADADIAAVNALVIDMYAEIGELADRIAA